jgi:(p)ppGpp synthase/HD superfamily hydrolase
MIADAELLATAAHGRIGQVRKGSGRPYIEHPQRVARAIFDLRDDRISQETVAAAYLHDTLEDTDITEEEILQATNPRTLEIVKELTNPSKQFVFLPEYKKLPRGAVRAMKKKMDRDHLAHVSWDAKVIKLVDRIDNVSDMVGMDRDFCLLYADESDLLLEALRGTHDGLESALASAIFALRNR